MKKRVLSALLALCLTLSLAGAAFAENETLSPAQETSVSESASSAAEPQEEKESEVEAEEISTAETAQEPSYPAQDFEAAVDGADMAVNVSAPEGALPEDVTLTASLVGSSEDNADDQAVADVAAELDDADVEYDGFVALDISFVDADGNKVEPLQPVSVNFTLPAELLPEDVDASTLEVQHLKEDVETEEVVAVETVADTADATEGTVTVAAPVATMSEGADSILPADAAVTAAFEVYGFSVFTITWKGEGSIGSIVEFNLKAVCVDTEGHKVGLVDFEKTYTWNFLGGSNELLVDDIAPVFYGYDFIRAEITSNNTVYEVEKIQCGRNALSKNYKAYYNGKWNDIKDNQIRFVYQKEDEGTGGSEIPTTLSHEKYVELNEDGTYDLNLTAVGSVGSEERKAQVDVVYVLDMSSSMDDSLDGSSTAIITKKRIKLASDAIRSMAENLTKNDKIDAQFALAKFGTREMDSMEWTNEPTVLLNALETSAGSNQGTNYEAGLKSANNLLGSSTRDGAIKIVIFVSDGDPTYYGTGQGNGGSFDQTALDRAKVVVTSMSDIDHFYAVGVGPNSSYSHLGELINAVAEGVETQPVFEGKDEQSLSGAFDSIEGNITYIRCSNVTISDTLSSYVEVISNSEKVEIYNSAGELVAGPDKTVSYEGEVFTAKYDETTRQLTLDFPNNYTLQQDWTYKVTAAIQPNQAAYDLYQSSNGYPNKGDAGTGTTSEDKDGFFSNERATLTYTVNGEEKTEDYAMPVVQLTPKTLTIQKTFENLTPEQIDKITGLSFVVTLKNDDFKLEDGITSEAGKRTISVQFTTGEGGFSRDGNTLKYSYSIVGISPNTTYSIKEEGEELDDYDVTVQSENDNGEFNSSQEKIAKFTNTYTEKPKVADLTINKNLSQNIEGNVTQKFIFTIEQTSSNSGDWIEDETKFNNGTVVFRERKASVEITGDGQFTVKDLPIGTYKITEEKPGDIDLDTSDGSKKDYYWTETQYQVGESTTQKGLTAIAPLREATTVTFTNNYKPYKTLTVKKVVTGEMGSSSDYFDFSAKIDGTPVALINQSDDEKTKAAGYDFKLNSNGDVTLVNLKENDTVIISEAANDNRGYTAKEPTVTSTVLNEGTSPEGNYTVSGNTSFTITVPGGDTTDLGIITFNNERKAVAPTGLEDNHTKPFGLMVGVAVMAGLALAGGAVVRRRRRWME